MNLTKERLLAWVVPVLLACVLIGLAFLQYQWSSEISEATTTRVHAALHTSLMNFREDLSCELGTLCLELQGEPDTSSPDANALYQHLQLWQRTSSVPGLIGNVYLWKVSESGRTLLQLNIPRGQFETVAWPSRMQRLRQVLFSSPAAHATNSSSASGSAGHPPKLPAPIFKIGGIDQSIPILVVPETPSLDPGTNWLLVELDLQVLQQQLLPQLVARYFGDARTSDYEVAVMATGGKQPIVLYSSNPGFLKDGDINGDSSLNLFGPPIAGRGPHPPLDFFRFGGVLTPGSEHPSPGYRSIFGPVRFDPIHYEGDDGDWHIIVKHRKGSIAASVAGLRRRNLALSFGVLLVLAASMALIMFNSARAQRLAMLQMDFVAGVSHELRTPVAAILSIGDNMASNIVEDKKQFVAYGDLIRNQARLLNHLVEQVLRFSATTKKVSNYRLLPVQVSDIIKEALENTAVLIASFEVEVHSTLEPDLPVVNADFSALSQCLQNLITNAVKYGGERKWIGIHAARGEESRTPEVEITVEDKGIGIEPEYLSHIFDPFYRSPKLAGSEIHGTGLGLALAKSFIEAMGGHISVRSQVSKGTAFTLHLPVKGPQFEAQAEVEQESRYFKL